jgi:Asp-tRNA(Asn)/Glu-tRNA(Gln) amidotransferase A subunit family amidase
MSGSMISLLDILRRIDSGQTTPQAAIAATLDLVAEKEPGIRAFVHIDDRATAADDGALRGIAVGVKDIIDVAGMPTQMGSAIYDGWMPRGDASVTAMFRRVGATPIGKTTTTAFAFLDPTPTLNPHSPAHSPGGSSSGSAAAVGGGMLPLAIGTQTGGSVIRPASFCGTAAIKPSYRLLPTVGVKCYSSALDTLGLFAAGIPDLAFALAHLTGRPEMRLAGDKAEASGAGLRIGVLRQDFAGPPEDDSAAALDFAIRAAERLGAQMVPLEAPSALAEAFVIHAIIQDYEVHRALAWEYDNHRDLLPPILRAALDEARNVTAAEFDNARRAAHRARGSLNGMMEGYDALITYSSPGAAPAGLSSTGNSRFNRLWTLMGDPCVNVPGFVNDAGLPVGVQVITRFGSDDKALRIAAFVEQALRASL